MQVNRKSIFALIVLAGLFQPGCAWQSKDGTRNHLVFGFGVVTTKDTSGKHKVGNGLDARARRIQSMGVLFHPASRPAAFVVGYAESEVLEVAPRANLLIDLRRRNHDLRVNARRAPRQTPATSIGKDG